MKKALILSGIYWNDSFQRHQQFTLYLLKMGYEVYFIEHIISTKFSIKKFINILLNYKKDKKIINNSKPKNLHVLNMKFINPQNGFFKLINYIKVLKLLKIIEEKKFDLIINYLPINTTRFILEKVFTSKLVYDCVRDFENWDGCIKKNIKIEEKLLFEKSDIIFTDSYYLKEKLKKSNKKIIQFLPVANDYWIRGCQRVKKVTQIRKIGYFGTIGKHIDTEILKKLKKDNYELHFWGIKEKGMKFQDYVYHGYKDNLTELAEEIIENVDAIILPYNKLLKGVIPAKMLQALTTFLPVFMVEFYDSKKLKEYIYIYNNYIDLREQLKNFSEEDFFIKKNKIKDFLRDKNEEKQFKLFEESINS